MGLETLENRYLLNSPATMCDIASSLYEVCTNFESCEYGIAINGEMVRTENLSNGNFQPMIYSNFPNFQFTIKDFFARNLY